MKGAAVRIRASASVTSALTAQRRRVACHDREDRRPTRGERRSAVRSARDQRSRHRRGLRDDRGREDAAGLAMTPMDDTTPNPELSDVEAYEAPGVGALDPPEGPATTAAGKTLIG